ncbi:MAG: protein-L-isoaspartate(D-aspartate) O-methyltransferase [Planctomycetes bacterium]|nr:protein-L-isoaspartate(D-aspartate) O-methyltransferase [Planctomycetota bacterium]
MSHEQRRIHLVDTVLRNLGIEDESVLAAMRSVPREEFVSEEMQKSAYSNVALPIEEGQTISQPLIVAQMAEALNLSGHDRVLDIGTGSGYAAAVMSLIAKDVYSMERHTCLAQTAADRLHRLGYSNIHVRAGDGTQGWPEKAPFDAINVAACGESVPPALLSQLKLGGRLVMPVGELRGDQQLIRVIRKGEEQFSYEELGGVRFVPLVPSVERGK